MVLSLHKSFTSLLCLGKVSLSPAAGLMINLIITCTDNADDPYGGGGMEKQCGSRRCRLPHECLLTHNPFLGALCPEAPFCASDMYH